MNNAPLSFYRAIALIAPFFAARRLALIGTGTLAIGVSGLSALEPLFLQSLFDGFMNLHRFDRRGYRSSRWSACG